MVCVLYACAHDTVRVHRFGYKFRSCWEDPDGELLNDNADKDGLMLWLS